MARGRIISNAISNSRKVNSVSDQAALLFSWIQAHTDDYGRIEGETQDVLFLIVPRRGWSEGQVEQFLKELWEVGLLKKYTDDGKRYFEVYAFDEHQTFRSDRGRKAKYPVPSAYDNQWDTTVSQGEKTDREVKLSKGKLSTSKVKVKQKAVIGKPMPDAPEQETEVVKPLTPKEKAQQFFDGVEALKNKQEVPWLQEFLNAIVQKNTNVSKQAIWNEIKAFTSYWTELNGTGTRQKWTLQKTFEVERRLITWFNRAGFKGFSASGGAFAGSGKGKRIIGLEDDENEQQ